MQREGQLKRPPAEVSSPSFHLHVARCQLRCPCAPGATYSALSGLRSPSSALTVNLRWPRWHASPSRKLLRTGHAHSRHPDKVLLSLSARALEVASIADTGGYCMKGRWLVESINVDVLDLRRA